MEFAAIVIVAAVVLVAILFTENTDPAFSANPRDKKPGDGRSNWKHVRVCTLCREETGHQEFMTKICLSCGGSMPYLPRDAAKRSIKINGKWTDQLHDQGFDYLRENKTWVKYDEHRGEPHDHTIRNQDPAISGQHHMGCDRGKP